MINVIFGMWLSYDGYKITIILVVGQRSLEINTWMSKCDNHTHYNVFQGQCLGPIVS